MVEKLGIFPPDLLLLDGVTFCVDFSKVTIEGGIRWGLCLHMARRERSYLERMQTGSWLLALRTTDRAMAPGRPSS